jgi:hypothetical protein
MTPTLESRFRALLARHLGRVNHITPDSTGAPYIGVAHPLPTFVTAINLPFWWSAGPRKGHCAEMREITRAWYFVRSQHKPFEDMYLTGEGIDELLAADVAACESLARAMFAGFDHFPEAAQCAVLEIAWRRQDYSTRLELQHAIKAQDWAAAADYCWRDDLAWERNAEVRGLFLEAVQVKV